MRIVRATRQDWIWPGIFLLLGLAGAIVSFRYYQQAFPEASIDLRLTRDEVGRRAAQWLRMRGLDPDRFHESVVFQTDLEAKTYLERELPAGEAARLMATDLGICLWTVRRSKPPDKEELIVALGPRGELVSFDHMVAENAPGATLGEEEAQRLAEIFLRTQKGISLGDYTLVAHERRVRPKRCDYAFTWERNGFKVRDATFRLSIEVQGDEVGHFAEFLKIPEQWSRGYTRMRSVNDLLSGAAMAFYLPLLVAAIVVVVLRARRKEIAWKTVAAVGLIVGLVQAADVANRFSLMTAGMPSTLSYPVMLGLTVFVAAMLALIAALWVGLTAAAGGPLYAETVPSRLPLARLFTLSGLRTREFFFSTLIGYGMAGLTIGATVVFYLVARKFGAWSPLEVSYSNALSTPLPWLAPLAASLLAATSEEFSFRFFAIPLLRRWLKSRWLAILIPAFIWGFLHSNYPQQPAWIRGVEVGAIGVLAGWVMLRFGILATLVWHYTIDAVLIGLFLIRSEHVYFRISGVLVADAVLIPLVICVVLYFQQGGFVEETEEDRRPVVPTEEPAVAAREITTRPAAAYTPILASRLRLAVIGAAVIVALIALASTPSIADFVRFTVRPAQAEAVARQALKERGVDLSRFQTATQVVTHAAPAIEYLRRQVGLRQANRLYESSPVRVAEWETRFFRPLSKEEYRVRTAPDGRDPRIIYIQNERAPGAKLDAEAARARVEGFLRGRGVVLGDFKAVESTLDTRDARNDYRFVWEGRTPIAGDARERIGVRLVGDVVSGPDHTVKVPEEWERQFTALRFGQLGVFAVLLGLFCIVLVMFIRRIGQRETRNRTYVAFAITAAVVVAAHGLLGWPAWAASYDTAVTWSNAVVLHFGGILLLAMGALAVGLLVLVADTLLARDIGLVPFLPARGAGRAGYLRDALVAGGAAAAFLWFSDYLPSLLVTAIPQPLPAVSVDVGPALDSLWPAGAALLSTVLPALIAVPALGVAVALVRRSLDACGRTWTVIFLLLVAASVALVVGETWLGFLIALVGVTAGVAAFGGVVWLLGKNATAYLVAIAVYVAFSKIKGLARHPAYQGDALVYVAMLAAVGLALALWWRREAGLEATTRASPEGPHIGT